jgi:hypothetical protein
MRLDFGEKRELVPERRWWGIMGHVYSQAS